MDRDLGSIHPFNTLSVSSNPFQSRLRNFPVMLPRLRLLPACCCPWWLFVPAYTCSCALFGWPNPRAATIQCPNITAWLCESLALFVQPTAHWHAMYTAQVSLASTNSILAPRIEWHDSSGTSHPILSRRGEFLATDIETLHAITSWNVFVAFWTSAHREITSRRNSELYGESNSLWHLQWRMFISQRFRSAK
jgi:hypothetical protein